MTGAFMIAFYLYLVYLPVHDVDYYYKQILSKENSGRIILNDADIEKFSSCHGDYRCFRDFYKELTLKVGLQVAFKHLEALNQYNDGQYYGYCHQNSHGIAHGEYILSKMNLGKSLTDFYASTMLNNMVGCGGGYFHGLLESFSLGFDNKESLVIRLKDVCKKFGEGDSMYQCFHGIGHASLIQLNYNLNDSLYVCDNISGIRYEQINCHVGSFMEYFLQDFSTEASVIVKENNNSVDVNYVLCNLLDEKYKIACYRESYNLVRGRLKAKNEYVKLMSSCKSIKERNFRQICIDKVAIVATTGLDFVKISEMCKQGTVNMEDRVVCTSSAAYRIASALDQRRTGDVYNMAISDICKTLPFFEFDNCVRQSHSDLIFRLLKNE
jgi:hypothetical protein